MSDAPRIPPLAAWMLAARPKTLPAAVAPVCVGTALAIAHGRFAPMPALAALLGALLLQIGVNLANDYFDYMRRIDTPERLGPMRVTHSGLIAPATVRLGMWSVFVAVAVTGIYLVRVGGMPILLVGVAAILSALAYSGGPYPLASHGLGEVFVFVFFGPVAVCGTYYVQARIWDAMALWAAVPTGLMITAILVVNNLRDIETDRKAGKRTVAVMIGPSGSRLEYLLLIAGAYLWMLGARSGWVLITMVSLPAAIAMVRAIFILREAALNRLLAGTARLALAFALLLAVGLLL